ncbi:MAG: hypothetical protein LBT38_07105 [Deltaproteobacteria bacterium]|jgi:type IV pilus assembly protein PilY1|nr:hypothetical protein [Deltaproteobacteria bacterium]
MKIFAKGLKNLSLIIGLSFGAFLFANQAQAVSPDKTLYQTSPFMSAYRTIPRVLLILSRDYKMFQQAYNGLIDIDGDNKIDTGFNPGVVYYGYFDSYSCYKFVGTVNRAGDPTGYFQRAGATTEDEPQTNLDRIRTTNLGNDRVKAGRSAVGICQPSHSNSGGDFSGNWLNFMTATRIDVIRKILYGGHRIIDSATGSNTILIGSFVPRDSNSFGFEVLADDRWSKETPMSVYYDVSKYTPFPKPDAGSSHFFARAKNSAGSNNTNYPVFMYLLSATKSTFKSGANVTGLSRYFDWVLQEGPNPSDSNLSDTAKNAIRSYGVRVKVCERDNLGAGEDCREYPNGNLKPVGLLQKNGESGDMYFGLLSGSYFDNSTISAYNSTRLEGGVLRNHIDHLNKSVNLQTGQVIAGGLISNLDTFAISSVTNRSGSAPSEGQKYVNAASWGNPTGEMLYEGVRYFSSIKGPSLSPTSKFLPPSAENNYNLYNYFFTTVAPYYKTWTNPPVLAAGECSKPIILLISEIDSDADGDTTINSGDGGLTSAKLSTIKNSWELPNFNMVRYLQEITSIEKFNQGQTYFYSKSKSDNCFPKTLNTLNDVRGLCPYRPGFEGSYSAAAVAYFSHTHNFGLGTRELGLDVYSVTMSGSFPALDFPIINSAGQEVKKITILPASMSQQSAMNTQGRILNFLNYYILEWWVDSKGMPYHVKIKVNYEDSAIGFNPDSSYPNSDWDMDVLMEHTIDLLTESSSNKDDASKINFKNTATASGALKSQNKDYYKFKSQDDGAFAISPSDVVGLSIKSWKVSNSTSQKLAMGYTISGTTHDGTYMDVGHNGGIATYGTPPTCNWPKGYGVNSASHNGTNCLTAFGNSNQAHNVGDYEYEAAIRTFEFSNSADLAGEFLPNPLYLAAKYGGFQDLNYNGQPDPGEWEGADGNPKNYFQATNITELPAKLEAAFHDIARSISTGTATSASVNSVLGGGISIQTAFYPMYVNPKDSSQTISWVGTVYALFVDKWGNLREDSNSNGYLDSTDSVVTFTSVKYPPDPAPACYVLGAAITRCQINARNEVLSTVALNNIHELKSLWDAGKKLVSSPTNNRKIYYINPDSNQIELFNTEPATVSVLKNYMVHDNYKQILPSANPNAFTKEQATTNLITYIRGDEITDWRNRTVANPWNPSNPNDNIVWRLADIINSKPVIVGQPPFNYDHLYNDKSYATFKTTKGARRQVAYFGSNDGFLHAIDMGHFGSLANGQVGYYNGDLGQELWAIIPGSLLPHLQWLADPAYIHSYYVDMKPLIADIKDNGQWKTILICGLRLGGRPIQKPVDLGGQPNQYSEIFALDVTDPNATPTLLWNFSAAELGLSVGLPAVVTSNGKWYAVLASGPATDFPNSVGDLTFGVKSPYDGYSSQKAKLFVLDATDGALIKTLEAPENNSFFNEPYIPISLKRGNNGSWNDETIYYGQTISRDSDCLDKGGVYRLQMIQPDGIPLPVNQWQLRRFISVDKPVTGAVNSSLDSNGNLWVIFGTGRMWGLEDITPCSSATNVAACQTNHEQYLYGVKEELANGRMTFADRSDLTYTLIDVSQAEVFENGSVTISNITGIYDYNAINDRLNLNSTLGYKRRFNLSERLTGSTSSNEIATTPARVSNVGSGNSILAITTYEPKVESCGDYGQGFMYVLDPFTGLPSPFLAKAFKSSSTTTPPVPGAPPQPITGGVSTGSGQPSAASLVILGDTVIARTSTTENSIVDVSVTTDQKISDNVISWREVFNAGFELSQNMMTDDVVIQP